jgi:hypothetical protein
MDQVRVELVMSRKALDLLVACANIGYEGAEGDLGPIDDVGDLLDKLAGIPDSANNGVFIHQAKGECRVFIADDQWVNRGFEEELGDQGGPADCAIGLHSWVNEVGKLPADTPCDRCGETYGEPN